MHNSFTFVQSPSQRTFRSFDSINSGDQDPCHVHYITVDDIDTLSIHEEGSKLTLQTFPNSELEDNNEDEEYYYTLGNDQEIWCNGRPVTEELIYIYLTEAGAGAPKETGCPARHKRSVPY